MRWLVESWRAAHQARARGVDVRAVTCWALFGSANWDSLVTRHTGQYEPGAFDVRAPVPRPTALASIVATLAAGGEPRHPALTGIPWWQRPDRLIHGTAPRSRSSSVDGPPLLIIGATGTLGSALQRVAQARGLTSRLVRRQEVDITDPTAVDAILRRCKPWAVINAAGYVRVDDAEQEPEACRRANVAGPMNLAGACRRRGIRLVTFSSDLVFDGVKGRPYIEADRPRPLNIYGQTKAEAERRVLDVLPDALVVRTSAFFGPWDEHNVLARLFRALDDGRPFRAPFDHTVSPTYVPDLAHASLDLLIDGEDGIWHLANDGALTWFEFAVLAAARSGRRVDLVVPSQSAGAGRAVRPRYSVLSSGRGRLLRPLGDAVDDFVRQAEAAVRRAGTG